MSRIVNALYDSRAEAEVARARLASELGVDQIRIIGKTSASEISGLDISEDDRRAYAEGVSRGATLLTARVKGNVDEDRLVGILKGSARGGAGADGARLVSEERIPVVEEELRVGKREVVRGGARVHSEVRHVPAEASVTLKQERIDVDRRPGNRFLSDGEVNAGGLLKQRVIELSEMREEPVIIKRPFVREELIVKKTVEERTETIHDTVRRTEVDVERLGPSALPQLDKGGRRRD